MTIAIIPAFNEATRIGPVITGALRHVSRVLVVDDCSHDETAHIAHQAGATVIRHPINLGKSGALKTGCKAALLLGATTIVFLDADGQHDPEDIPNLLAALRQGADVALGTRSDWKLMPRSRRLGNFLVAYVMRIFFSVQAIDVQCGFRAFRAEVLPKIAWQSKRYHADAEMMARVGKHKLTCFEVPIKTIYHEHYKGMTIIDGLGLLYYLVIWRMTLK